MDWDNERIDRHKNIDFYEHDALRLWKKSNKYTIFARCAFRSYKFGSYEYKKAIILAVTGRPLLPGGVDVQKLVQFTWRDMHNDCKNV